MDEDPWRNPFAEPEPNSTSTSNDLKQSDTLGWDSTLPIGDLRTSHSTFEPLSWEPTSVAVNDDGGWTSSAFVETPTWDSESPEILLQVNSNADVRPQSPLDDTQVTLNVHNLDKPDRESESPGDHDVDNGDYSEPSTPTSRATTHHVPGVYQGPETFSGFESGGRDKIDTEDPWQASVAFVDNAWSSAGTPDAQSSQGEEQEPAKDEWDAALETQKQRENVVTRERLNGWIAGMETALSELWPSSDSQPLDDYSWRISMDADGKIAQLLETVLPEIQLPRLSSFHQTQIYASQARALKLTRNFPLSLKSPLSLLQISKGSASWEKSVRQDQKRESYEWGKFAKSASSPPAPKRKDKLDIVSSPKVEPTLEEEKKTIRSGIMSFLGTKAAPLSSLASKSTETRSDQVGQLNEVAFSSPPQHGNGPLHVSNTLIGSLETAGEPSAPDAEHESTVEPIAPSIVSRFLNRITRGKSSASENAALSLSNSDFSYLEDMDSNPTLDDVELKFDEPILDKSSIPESSKSAKARTIVPSSFLPSSQELSRQRAVADAMFSGSSKSSTSSVDIWDLPIASTSPISDAPQRTSRDSISSESSITSPTLRSTKVTGLPRPPSITNPLQQATSTLSSSPISPTTVRTTPKLPPPARSSGPPVQRPPLTASLNIPTPMPMASKALVSDDDFDNFVSSPPPRQLNTMGTSSKHLPRLAMSSPPSRSSNIQPNQVQSAFQRSTSSHSSSTASKPSPTLNFDFLNSFGGSTSVPRSGLVTPGHQVGPTAPSWTSPPEQSPGFPFEQQDQPPAKPSSSVIDPKTGLSAQDLSFFEGL